MLSHHGVTLPAHRRAGWAPPIATSRHQEHSLQALPRLKPAPTTAPCPQPAPPGLCRSGRGEQSPVPACHSDPLPAQTLTAAGTARNPGSCRDGFLRHSPACASRRERMIWHSHTHRAAPWGFHVPGVGPQSRPQRSRPGTVTAPEAAPAPAPPWPAPEAELHPHPDGAQVPLHHRAAPARAAGTHGGHTPAVHRPPTCMGIAQAPAPAPCTSKWGAVPRGAPVACSSSPACPPRTGDHPELPAAPCFPGTTRAQGPEAAKGGGL